MCISISRMMNLCKRSKRAEHAETGNFQRKNKSNNQRPRNLKNKEGNYSNTKLTVIFCVIYFSFDSQKRVPGLTEGTAVVKQLKNEYSTSRLKD